MKDSGRDRGDQAKDHWMIGPGHHASVLTWRRKVGLIGWALNKVSGGRLYPKPDHPKGIHNRTCYTGHEHIHDATNEGWQPVVPPSHPMAGKPGYTANKWLH